MATASTSVLQEFVCSVCLEYFKQPYTLLPCNHVYCKACLTQLKNSHISHCPQCRTTMTGYCPDDFMTNKMRTTEIQCRKCNNKMKASDVNEHIAQCSDRPEDFEDVTAGGATSQVSLFKCPFCGKDNIKTFEMLQHCVQYHKNDNRKVVCPICASMPWGDPTLKSSHLISHLQLRHRFDYENYVELWETDENAAIERAISESLDQHQEAGVSDFNQALRESVLTYTPTSNLEDSVNDSANNQQETDVADDAFYQAIRESLNIQAENSANLSMPSNIESYLGDEVEETEEEEALNQAVRESISSQCQHNPDYDDVQGEMDEELALAQALSESLFTQPSIIHDSVSLRQLPDIQDVVEEEDLTGQAVQTLSDVKIQMNEQYAWEGREFSFEFPSAETEYSGNEISFQAINTDVFSNLASQRDRDLISNPGAILEYSLSDSNSYYQETEEISAFHQPTVKSPVNIQIQDNADRLRHCPIEDWTGEVEEIEEYDKVEALSQAERESVGTPSHYNADFHDFQEEMDEELALAQALSESLCTKPPIINNSLSVTHLPNIQDVVDGEKVTCQATQTEKDFQIQMGEQNVGNLKEFGKESRSTQTESGENEVISSELIANILRSRVSQSSRDLLLNSEAVCECSAINLNANHQETEEDGASLQAVKKLPYNVQAQNNADSLMHSSTEDHGEGDEGIEKSEDLEAFHKANIEFISSQCQYNPEFDDVMGELDEELALAQVLSESLVTQEPTSDHSASVQFLQNIQDEVEEEKLTCQTKGEIKELEKDKALNQTDRESISPLSQDSSDYYDAQEEVEALNKSFTTQPPSIDNSSPITHLPDNQYTVEGEEFTTRANQAQCHIQKQPQTLPAGNDGEFRRHSPSVETESSETELNTNVPSTQASQRNRDLVLNPEAILENSITDLNHCQSIGESANNIQTQNNADNNGQSPNKDCAEGERKIEGYEKEEDLNQAVRDLISAQSQHSPDFHDVQGEMDEELALAQALSESLFNQPSVVYHSENVTHSQNSQDE